ncbi:MAG TPA: hypothetical protein VJ992_03880 [Gemmatimonadales bacterium]|nr:hypothetical protein [Gemmatimonadales bacterium]
MVPRGVLGGVTAILIAAAPLAAQGGLIDMGAAQPRVHRAGSGDGFLFTAPNVTLELRGGWNFARASSDIFSFVDSTLTLNKSDFNSLAGGAELGLRLNDRFTWLFDLGLDRTSHPSEFRDWVDQNNLPIQQRTTLTRVPLTVGVKAYLLPPGRSVGDFAWLPSRLAVYVGAAGGIMHYQFTQHGDFVDYTNSSIFTTTYSSGSWGAIGQVLGGAELGMTKHFALDMQARYTFGSAPMNNAFVNFNAIDLSGLQTTLGLSWRL